jgi:hypothetical protein
VASRERAVGAVAIAGSLAFLMPALGGHYDASIPAVFVSLSAVAAFFSWRIRVG